MDYEEERRIERNWIIRATIVIGKLATLATEYELNVMNLLVEYMNYPSAANCPLFRMVIERLEDKYEIYNPMRT